MALLLIAFIPTAAAWSFSLDHPPIPCSPLNISFTGGEAPWEFTLLQFPPYASAQARNASTWQTAYGSISINVVDEPDMESGMMGSGMMPMTKGLLWPFGPLSTDSRLVVVGSDASGFGSGGTTDVMLIEDKENDTSCSVTGIPPNETDAFAAFMQYPTSVSQCQHLNTVFRDNLIGPITADMIVPLGQSYRAQVDNPDIAQTDAAEAYSSFSWNTSLKAGTEVGFVLGAAGGTPVLVSALMTVQAGDNSCNPVGTLSAPISTASATASAASETTAAASRPTAPTAASSSSSSSSSHVGAIAGGIVGGVFGALLLAALAMFLLRMYNLRKRRAAQHIIRMSVWRHSTPEKLERASWGQGYKDGADEGASA